MLGFLMLEVDLCFCYFFKSKKGLFKKWNAEVLHKDKKSLFLLVKDLKNVFFCLIFVFNLFIINLYTFNKLVGLFLFSVVIEKSYKKIFKFKIFATKRVTQLLVAGLVCSSI